SRKRAHRLHARRTWKARDLDVSHPEGAVSGKGYGVRPSLTWVTVAVVVVSLTAVTVSAASPVDAKPLAANGPNVAAQPSNPAVVRNATWYLRDSTTSGAADHVFQYGDPGDIPVFGDWDRNGTRTPSEFRSRVWY